MASYIGNSPENDLRWRHVYSKKGGNYTMTVRYFSAENRRTLISVNGEKVLTQTLNSGGWGTAKEVKVNVTLQPGDNEVRIYTDGNNWLPNIDCMTLAGEDNTEANEKKLEMLTTQLDEVKDKAMTAVMKAQVDELLQQAAQTDIPADELNTLVSEMQKAITTVNSMEKNCNDFLTWMQNAQLNVEASEANAALPTLQEEMASAQAAYDEALTAAKVNTALNTLKTALKNYLKSDEAQPAADKNLDMTLLLSNPDLSATSGWSGSPAYADGVAECYNKNFNVYQNLTGMKPGIYEISCQALYRTGENDGGKLYSSRKEVIPARFYANLDSVAVPSLYKYKFTTTAAAKYSETDIKNLYANSTLTASVAFASKRYPCTLTTTLSEKGSLRIGFVTKQHDTDNWLAFDDLHILYTPLPQEDAILSPSAPAQSEPTLYDLSGRKVTRTTQSGIYIKKGKKMVVK